MVYRMHLTYDEIIDILDIKFYSSKRTCYTLPPGIYETIDINLMLNTFFTDEVKANVTIDDITLKFNLKINQSIIYRILGFTE